MKLNIGCGEFYQHGWVNADVVSFGPVKPDVLMEPYEPWPWPDNVAEQVYLGHVLEHVPWEDVPAFVAEAVRVVIPGGPVVAVGPDWNRAVEEWHAGRRSWDWLLGVPEDDWHYQKVPPGSVGARHQWNCYEARLVRALQAGGLTEVHAVPVQPGPLTGWPVVDYSPEQCGAMGKAP